MKQHLIRNFCIIAHIDHGKSTLADRLLEFTGSINKREFRDQVLDNMDLERERGITIKASSVRLIYKAQDGNDYILNLVDTPGHVDFTYEVSKSLAACEGAILVIDAVQGVEAQTVANLCLALEYKLVVVPIINKIDLSNADPERVKKQIGEILKLDNEDVILASAKRNVGTEEILEQIVKKIPPPQGNGEQPLQALVFDSVFDVYKGAIIHTRVVNGTIRPNMEITMMAKESRYQVQEVGIFKPRMEVTQNLTCGEVGFITCNIRDPNEVIVGDTITDANHPAGEPLPGCRKFYPMVFSGIYPVNAKDFSALRIAMEKLKLNDASFIYEPESSGAIGMGFRCGFLGLLHMEIVQERLEREYDLNLVITTPSVVYRVTKEDGEKVEIDNPAKLPAANKIKAIEEPYVIASIIVPPEAIGSIMKLAEERRGTYKATEYLSSHKVKLSYILPLSEIIVDFYDKIKSLTRGYGSLDYAFKDYQKSDLVKLDILINSDVCDALSLITHKTKAVFKGRALVEKLKELIPRQMFEVIIQAAIGTNIITRQSVRAMKKDVISKCYGGDITRKRKLWEKQKKGKKRMKRFGRVQIPQEAFMAVLKTQ